MFRLLLSLQLILFTLTGFAQNITNYSFSAVSGSFSAIQSTSGAISPVLSSGTLDDGYYNNIPIGFAFMYDGVLYSSVSASTNGWARFGSTTGGSFATNNLNTGTNRPLVAPLWDDLLMSPGGFSYKTSGIYPNRICTLEWLNVTWSYLASSPSISFQVKLYESTRRVEFIYRQEAGTVSSSSASIGIAGVTSGQFLSLNNTSTTPAASSITETTTIFAKPLTGQIYRFDHWALVPVISSVTPITGYTNTSITITGNNFDFVLSSLVVWCGSVKASITSASYTQIVATVPRGTNYERITVTNLSSGRTAASDEKYDVQYGCGEAISWTNFNSPVNFSSGSGSRSVEISDIDDDGKNDVVVTSDGSGGACVFRNTSVTGTFTAGSLAAGVSFVSSAGQPGDVEFIDVDGDGKKDMLIADYSTTSLDSVSVFRNTSVPGTINSSSFAPRVTFKVPGYPSLASADIDGDGKPEMIAACEASNQLIVRRNLSSPGSITTGSFGANVVFTTPTAPWGVASGDLDGDGKADVVTINGTPVFSVFLNTATPGIINASSFAPRADFTTAHYGSDIEIADVDGNGKQDIVVSYSNYSLISVFKNNSTPGNLVFSEFDFASGGGLSQGFDLGDIDGDGLPDIVLNNSCPVVIRNTCTPGTISFDPPVNINSVTGTYATACADLDGDSKPEILATKLSAGTVSVLYNAMSSFTALAPATVLNATTFCDDGTWKTYCDPLDHTKVLFAIKDNGNNLGTITVDEYRDAAPGNYAGTRYLQRHFRINPTFQPSSAVQVRLYYTSAELSNLTAVDPSVMSSANLSVTKYDGPTEDGTYYTGDATSLLWIPPASITTGTQYGGNYLQFTVTSFSEFWIHGGTGVLPIELISFHAEPVDRTVHLDWQTATETNNDYFTIERSADGVAVETIDTIDGAGNSTSMLDYSAIDAHPYEGVSYYRLKQVDFNGESSYSEWQAVDIASMLSVKLYPNPSDGNITLELPGDYEAVWTLCITTMTGQIAYQRTGSKRDMETQHLDLAGGSYLASITSENATICQKMIITDQ